jgi:hypothetical protein
VAAFGGFFLPESLQWDQTNAKKDQTSRHFTGYDFGASEEGISFGRYVTSEGQEHFVAQNSVTLNATNSGPKIGPIVINEVMYHPRDVASGDDSTNEFIELLNISANAVPLYDPALPTNTWHLTGGIDFVFPTNVSLAPGESLLVLNIAPTNAAAMAAFRSTYSFSSNLQVFGPYSGKLDNDSQTLNLRKPTAPITNQLAEVSIPYALVDGIQYKDSLPWAPAADGFGFSLQRWNPRAYGDDPTNWVASIPTPGALTYTNGVVPAFTTQPTNMLVVERQALSLSGAVSGSAPLYYQWQKNGTNVPGATNVVLQFASVRPEDAGDYHLIAYNAVGAVFSQTATVSVRVAVALFVQPQTTDVRVQPDPSATPSTNATFTVLGSSTAPIRYQWYRDGQIVPNATNTSITITNVTTNDLSYFYAVLTDDISTITTTNAWLYPLVSPNFVDLPIAQSVAVGTPVSLSVSASGFPPPFTFEWRIGSTVVFSNVTDKPSSVYTFTAATNVSSTSYRAVVKNRALPSGRATAFVAVTTLADSDGDGTPDEWEARYGLASGNSADGQLDTDGDGMLNWQEYIAGTDPTNALSNLKFTTLVSSNGTLRLAFEAVSNKTYAVQYKGALNDPAWQTLVQTIATRTNRTETGLYPQASTNRFYRIVTPAP